MKDIILNFIDSIIIFVFKAFNIMMQKMAVNIYHLINIDLYFKLLMIYYND